MQTLAALGWRFKLWWRRRLKGMSKF